ncbi:PEBP-like protein [Trametopsis cervina]|nr:PEBP-like protein [Trametopsis cervina]
MLTLRKLHSRQYVQLLARGNATLQSTVTSSPPPPPPSPAQSVKAASTEAATQNPGGTTSAEDVVASSKTDSRKKFTSRPSITLERPRQYSRPVSRGVLPVYDLALKYIKQDANNIEVELAALQAQLKSEELSPEEKAQLTEKAAILEVQSAINLPSVRWKARNGMADMSKAVYRRILEQRWREEGELDLLMERIHTMNVVPDLLPSLHPSIDLRLNFPAAPLSGGRRSIRRKPEKVEPGVFLLPEQTRKPPHLYVTVFHPEQRLYTLVMVDLDVPDTANSSFRPYLHWLQPNISLHALSRELTLPTTHTTYIPPHPQRGTPYHRYAVVLLPQQSAEHIDVPAITDAERLGFDLRAFSQKFGLDGSKGGGAHMWREQWDPTVSEIYRETLKLEEPVFGRMPKPDPYAEVKKARKYD